MPTESLRCFTTNSVFDKHLQRTNDSIKSPNQLSGIIDMQILSLHVALSVILKVGKSLRQTLND